MILYNVTVNVETQIAEEWIKWMKEEHIPEVMQTGYFVEYKMMKLLTDTQNPHPTYAIQYFAKTVSDLDEYMKESAPELQAKHVAKFGERCLAFRTVLQEI